MTTTTSLLPELESIYATALASCRSVGTAVTMAAVGVYLHQRNFIGKDSKRTLAVISQQVTFPLFLFTKIIYCNQDWSAKPCPDVSRSLQDVWMLLYWPVVVVTVGLVTGWVVAKITHTPTHQVRSVLAACAFGNSTGLPITLLTVVHTNFPATSDLGRIDPTLFLSVYLLLYPVLQWGLGGWLLAPDDDDSDDDDDELVQQEDAQPESNTRASNNIHKSKRRFSGGGGGGGIRTSLRHNVLNNTVNKTQYKNHHRGLSSADEGLYLTTLDLQGLMEKEQERERQQLLEDSMYSAPDDDDGGSIIPDSTENSLLSYQAQPVAATPNGFYGAVDSHRSATSKIADENDLLIGTQPQHSKRWSTTRSLSNNNNNTNKRSFDAESMWQTLCNILERCFQPPVVGAVAGLVVAMIPQVRGVLVDIVDRNSSAPLQWLFDGLYAVGTTAVPINMMILGCNLSSSALSSNNKANSSSSSSSNNNSDGLLSTKTMIGIVVGKMIVMPFIGILTGFVLKHYVWHIPDHIDGAFYLVLMIVFLTPTANNVMVMVELSGSGAKEGIARVIALQYAVAPILLSLTMTIAIGVASEWSS